MQHQQCHIKQLSTRIFQNKKDLSGLNSYKDQNRSLNQKIKLHLEQELKYHSPKMLDRTQMAWRLSAVMGGRSLMSAVLSLDKIDHSHFFRK